VSTYSVTGYGSMIADEVRMEAYARALRSATRPGSVVLDVGCGAAGVFALLACQYGARKVYAIEPDCGIELAREIAKRNGVADRVEFIQAVSTDVTLPERADVCISDLRGVLPAFRRHFSSIADARERLLSTGGILIPREDRLWMAVVEAPTLYEPYQKPWRENAHALDLTAGVSVVTNTWSKGRVTPDQLLSASVCWAVLDYAKLQETDIHGDAGLRVTREGTAHGLAIWFDSKLAAGVSLSNAPGAPPLIYGQAFFPFSEPVTVAHGDTVHPTMSANLVGEDYVWRWDTSVLDNARAGAVRAAFRQSSFFGAALSHASLRKRAASHVPALTADGEIQRHVLSMFGSQRSLQRIAEETLAAFPDRFKSWQQALDTVADLSEKYST
jgi:type I protein arginine methyltransferase